MISWKLTNNPGLINKVENGQNTTYERGTQGWHEFEQWKAQGNVPEEEITPLEQAAIDAVKYQELRRNEYPPLAEQLDMMYKDALSNGTTWKDLIQSIKVKYPKPTI